MKMELLYHRQLWGSRATKHRRTLSQCFNNIADLFTCPAACLWPTSHAALELCSHPGQLLLSLPEAGWWQRTLWSERWLLSAYHWDPSKAGFGAAAATNPASQTSLDFGQTWAHPKAILCSFRHLMCLLRQLNREVKTQSGDFNLLKCSNRDVTTGVDEGCLPWNHVWYEYNNPAEPCTASGCQSYTWIVTLAPLLGVLEEEKLWQFRLPR